MAGSKGGGGEAPRKPDIVDLIDYEQIKAHLEEGLNVIITQLTRTHHHASP
jgi:hypothetical protein